MGWVVINEVQDPVTETIEKVYGRTNVRINTWLNVREVSDNQGGPPECRLWGKSVDEETDVGHALHKKFTKVQVRVPGQTSLQTAAWRDGRWQLVARAWHCARTARGSARQVLVSLTARALVRALWRGAQAAGNCSMISLELDKTHARECELCWKAWEKYTIDKLKSVLWCASDFVSPPL